MKKRLNFPDQLNFLCPAGTREMLIAISFYRGQKGVYADAAKDFIADGIQRFKAGLSAKDKAAFDEILNTVRVSDTLRKSIKRDNPSG